MKKITRTQIAALPLTLPPEGEQAALTECHDRQMAKAGEVIAAAEAELAAVSALPAALLRGAFSGGL